jgi:hypothetical protein
MAWILIGSTRECAIFVPSPRAAIVNHIRMLCQPSPTHTCVARHLDRGGAPADKANYPVFMSKLKAAFEPRGYELSFTAPSSYWYLQHFDLPALLQSADWVCKRP